MNWFFAPDAMGGGSFARLMRSEADFWVEWVTIPMGEYGAELIIPVAPAKDPVTALEMARAVLTDVRAQIARGEVFPESFEADEPSDRLGARMVYARHLHPAPHEEPVFPVAYLGAEQLNALASARNIMLRELLGYERQLNAIPPLEDARWVLLPYDSPALESPSAKQDILSPESIDLLHAQDAAEAGVILTEVMLLEERRSYSFLMNYLHEHAGAATWLHPVLDAVPEADFRERWQRAKTEYAGLAANGQTWTIEIIYDEALRKAWLGVAKA